MMSRFLLCLFILFSLNSCSNARVLYRAVSHGNRNSGRESLIVDENEIEFDKLELFRRLLNQISEDEGKRGGTYSDKREAIKWMHHYDTTKTRMLNEDATANWNYSINITEYTQQQRDNTLMKWLPWSQNATLEASRFYQYKKAFLLENLDDLVRQLGIISRCGSRPSSNDMRLTQVSSQMETIFSSAEVTDAEGTKYQLEPGLIEMFKSSRDYDQLEWAWKAWRDQSGKLMKGLFNESASLQNEAVKAAGFNDAGDMWRACNYGEPEEKTPENKDLFVTDMTEDLLEQIQPLYKELHAYVRFRLKARYPEQLNEPWFQDDKSPIPAHLLGNMWAQQWTPIYELVEPFPDAPPVEVTETMKKNWTVPIMFSTAEEFFTSIGLPPMTDAFKEKSMFVRPSDGRQVVCHASAEDFSTGDDFRIKMCAGVNQNDLQTVHHEMGHIEYFNLYHNQPAIYREGANSAFHEAIGDTIALSVMTPTHLKKLYLLDQEDPSGPDSKWGNYLKRDINFLMKMALEKVAFLPFGYLIDRWRWDVFSGKITINDFNRKWWEYRLKYQGVAPPVKRSEEDFDPGAKYHIPANVPYIRYFLSFIGQFQFHKSLCDTKRNSDPKNVAEDLFSCDIYQSREAGKKLADALSLGSSKPWPEVMYQLTGTRKFDASAITSYFRPLIDWLRSERETHRYKRGWTDGKDVVDQFFES